MNSFKYAILIFFSLSLICTPNIAEAQSKGRKKKSGFLFPWQGVWLLDDFARGVSQFTYCRFFFYPSKSVFNSAEEEVLAELPGLSELIDPGKDRFVLVCEDTGDDVVQAKGKTTSRRKKTAVTGEATQGDGSDISVTFTASLDPDDFDTMSGTINIFGSSFPFTALRTDYFKKGTKTTLVNSIKKERASKRRKKKSSGSKPGDTVTFTSKVVSRGPFVLGEADAEHFIRLPEEVANSSVTIVSTDNMHDCSSIIDSTIPAQVQCRLGSLGPKNSSAEVTIATTIPEALAGKKFKVVVASDSKPELMGSFKVSSRPSRLQFKVGKNTEASPTPTPTQNPGPTPTPHPDSEIICRTPLQLPDGPTSLTRTQVFLPTGDSSVTLVTCNYDNLAVDYSYSNDNSEYENFGFTVKGCRADRSVPGVSNGRGSKNFQMDVRLSSQSFANNEAARTTLADALIDEWEAVAQPCP